MKLLALIIGCAPFFAHSIRFDNKRSVHDTTLQLQNHEGNKKADILELEKLTRKDERNGPTTKDKKDKGGDKKSKFDPK